MHTCLLNSSRTLSWSSFNWKTNRSIIQLMGTVSIPHITFDGKSRWFCLHLSNYTCTYIPEIGWAVGLKLIVYLHSAQKHILMTLFLVEKFEMRNTFVTRSDKTHHRTLRRKHPRVDLLSVSVAPANCTKPAAKVFWLDRFFRVMLSYFCLRKISWSWWVEIGKNYY